MDSPIVTPPVRLHITEAAVASIAAATAVGVPGVAATMASQAATSEAAQVTVTIAARLGHNCRDLAAAVQEAVALAVAEQAGFAARVTVTVADVLLA